jgi:hypothetical protein
MWGRRYCDPYVSPISIALFRCSWLTFCLCAVGDRSVALKVAGDCVCIPSSIEMTEAAFTALGAQISRPVTVNWVFD